MTEAIRAWKRALPPSPEPPVAIPRPTPSNQPTPDRARAFTRWDTDKDGVLTLEEYWTGLTNPTNAENRFKNFDKDGDGRLTRDEFVTPTPR
jgi:Ca2+-binding EF-hand superfamily protein